VWPSSWPSSTPLDTRLRAPLPSAIIVSVGVRLVTYFSISKWFFLVESYLRRDSTKVLEIDELWNKLENTNKISLTLASELKRFQNGWQLKSRYKRTTIGKIRDLPNTKSFLFIRPSTYFEGLSKLTF
jgi:hypothetical protein